MVQRFLYFNVHGWYAYFRGKYIWPTECAKRDVLLLQNPRYVRKMYIGVKKSNWSLKKYKAYAADRTNKSCFWCYLKFPAIKLIS